MFVLTILYAIADAIVSFSIIFMTSVLLEQLLSSCRFSELLRIVIGLVACYGIIYFLKLGLGAWRQHRIENLPYAYRQMVAEKVFSVPYEELEKVEFSELLNTIQQNDMNYSLLMLTVEDIQKMLKSAFSVLLAILSFGELYGVIKELGNMAFMVSMLILVIFVLIMGSTGYIAWKKKGNAKAEKRLDEELIKLNNRGIRVSRIFERYEWGKHIRMGRMQPKLLGEWDKIQKNVKEWFKHVTRLERSVSVLADISSTVISGMIYFTVGIIALAGGLGVGSIIWYAGVVQRLLESVRSLIFDFGTLQSRCIRQQPIFELLDIAASADSGTAEIPALQEHVIEFKDVSFAYPDTNRMILEHVNLRLSGQERIALVGRNGCGKSTLIKLLCRLYDPSEGRISLDGEDIRTFPRQEYMKMLSVVFQDFHIFADSLAGNIAMTDAVDRESAASIVERVGLGLTDLDQPLLRHLDEKGIEVSGGEGQKIAIARALYKDAPLVILDEPTAALDPLAESEIYEKFNLLVEGKLALFISHRLSSCRFCDRILVMQDGGIVQDGSHEELVAVDGLYQQMWNAQKQYYV